MSNISEQQGTEHLPDGRKIPYVRHCYPRNVVTTYGSHDASDHSKGISLLVKDERRGKASWGLSLNALDMRRGEASRVLQGKWGTSEVTELYFAVEFVRLFPETLKDTSTPDTAGSIIQGAILQAIKTGNPQRVYLLAKCIKAVDKTLPKDYLTYFISGGTKRRKVANAVCNAANRVRTIPTWQAALQEFCNAGGDPDEGNFTRALSDAGFGWILPEAES